MVAEGEVMEDFVNAIDVPGHMVMPPLAEAVEMMQGFYDSYREREKQQLP